MELTSVEPSADRHPPFRLMAWLRLVRLPTVLTALSNILCGYFISSSERSLPLLVAEKKLWLLLLSSACLYLSGMVLNDVFDAPLDAVERPERPIPSGQISRRSAAIFGSILMVAGIVAAWLAGSSTAHFSTSLLVAVLLAVCILLYDSRLKNTLAAPLGMATCRFLNLLLGASVEFSLPDVPNHVLVVAASLAIYVLGVTWFAKHETGEASERPLMFGLGIVITGLAAHALHCAWRMREQPNSAAFGALIALGLVTANLLFRIVRAIRIGRPSLLQKTVGLMLLNLVFIDAAMTFCLTGSARLAAAIVILVIPATLLKRFIPMS
ncbi:MAG: UbiA family prenyltransferase [Planctomycetaceae bacterium]